MSFFKESLGEPSTWLGICLVISAFSNITFSTEQLTAIAYLGTALFGGAGAVLTLPDRILKKPIGKKDDQDIIDRVRDNME